jgi:hypothetical protein
VAAAARRVVTEGFLLKVIVCRSSGSRSFKEDLVTGLRFGR